MSARLTAIYKKWSEVPSGQVDQFIRRIKERMNPEMGLALLNDPDKFDQWISAGNDIIHGDDDATPIHLTSKEVGLNALFKHLDHRYEVSYGHMANGTPIVTVFDVKEDGSWNWQRPITVTKNWTPLIEDLEIKHVRGDLFLIR